MVTVSATVATPLYRRPEAVSEHHVSMGLPSSENFAGFRSLHAGSLLSPQTALRHKQLSPDKHGSSCSSVAPRLNEVRLLSTPQPVQPELLRARALPPQSSDIQSNLPLPPERHFSSNNTVGLSLDISHGNYVVSASSANVGDDVGIRVPLSADRLSTSVNIPHCQAGPRSPACEQVRRRKSFEGSPLLLVGTPAQSSSPDSGQVEDTDQFVHRSDTMPSSALAVAGLMLQEACSPRRATESAAHSASKENAYLRKNVEHLRNRKRGLESQVTNLEDRVRCLDQQNQQYKALYEHTRVCHMSGDIGEMELSNLYEQLSAVQFLKDVLNTENMELQRRLEVALQAGQVQKNESKNACVICMDNLANVVCLPCKHLALCSFCGSKTEVSSCPICRCQIDDQMQIFMP